MPPEPYYGWYTSANTSGVTITSATTGITFPGQPIYLQPQAASEWERAAVKAEPDDEFSWLRKRVREVEELAFA